MCLATNTHVYSSSTVLFIGENWFYFFLPHAVTCDVSLVDNIVYSLFVTEAYV